MTFNSQKPVLDIVLAQARSMAELAWHVNPCVALSISSNETDMFLNDININPGLAGRLSQARSL
jgi:hypothetical protein